MLGTGVFQADFTYSSLKQERVGIVMPTGGGQQVWSWDEVRAAVQQAYSRGRSDERRGARRPGEGTVVSLVSWLEDRAGVPCRLDVNEVCTQRNECTHLPTQQVTNRG